MEEGVFPWHTTSRQPSRQVKTADTGAESWASCRRGWGRSYLIPSWDTSSSVLASGDVSLCCTEAAAQLLLQDHSTHSSLSLLNYPLIPYDFLFFAASRHALSALCMIWGELWPTYGAAPFSYVLYCIVKISTKSAFKAEVMCLFWPLPGSGAS